MTDLPAARARFDAALIPGMRARLAEAYRRFREVEQTTVHAIGPAAAPYHRRPCPRCAAPPPAEPVLSTPQIDVVECPRCGFAYARDVMDAEADSARYLASDLDEASLALRTCAPYLELESARARYYLDRIAEGGAAERRLLEIGAGTGTLLVEAQAAGWSAHGIEPGSRAAAAARARGVSVVEGYFPGAAVDYAPFDVIAMLDVLEHLEQPLAMLRTIREHLAPDGRLFVQVPNWESLLVRLEGAQSSTICPGHWSYFSADSLRGLLGDAGFAAVLVETVVTEADRIAAFPVAHRIDVAEQLRPGQSATAESLDAEAILKMGLGYKLIGVFRPA